MSLNARAQVRRQASAAPLACVPCRAKLGTKRVIICTGYLKWRNQLRLDIIRNVTTAHDSRAKLERRCLDQRGIESHGAKIIMQKGPASTVLGVAGDSDTGPTVAPMAGTTDICSRRIGEEDVCALASTLSPAFEPSAGSGEGSEVGVIIDRHKNIDVLRVTLVCR